MPSLGRRRHGGRYASDDSPDGEHSINTYDLKRDVLRTRRQRAQERTKITHNKSGAASMEPLSGFDIGLLNSFEKPNEVVENSCRTVTGEAKTAYHKLAISVKTVGFLSGNSRFELDLRAIPASSQLNQMCNHRSGYAQPAFFGYSYEVIDKEDSSP